MSYGGLILQPDVKLKDVLNSFATLLQQINEDGFSIFIIKIIPKIYHDLPSDEIDYLLFKTKANLLRRDLSSVIETEQLPEVHSSNRKRGLKRALNAKLEIFESLDFKMFWNDILIPNLKSRHQVTPTHSLEEIIKLHAHFPKNIRQFNVFNKQTLVAGVTIFESKHVAHVQYVSGNDQKQKLGSLDMVFDHLINKVYKAKKYFDFGISNEDNGQFINEGLMSWKESFGARSIAIDTYGIDTKNYNKLSGTLI